MAGGTYERTTLPACSSITVMGSVGGLKLCGITLETYRTCAASDRGHTRLCVSYTLTVAAVLV